MSNKAMAVCYDSQSCIKCYSCVVSCSVENRARMQHSGSKDVMISSNEALNHYNYLTVKTSEQGIFPNVKSIAALKHCFHCENPKCMDICPTEAITKEATGAVLISERKCIGCQSCVDACPFDVPVFSKETGKTYKCIMCNDRLEAGLQTACSQACPSVAIISGSRDEVVAESKKRAEHYSKVFGKEFKGYKGQEAINKLLKEKQGHIKGAFHREDMGDIDLVWGNEFCGLKHIIKRREEEKTGHAEKVLSKLSETITNATFRKRNKYGNFEFVYKKDNIQYFVIIAPEYHNKKMTYVLTAFNRYKK